MLHGVGASSGTGAAADFPRVMSATDSLMWRVEADPLLRSTVTAVSLLDRAPDWEQLQQRMALAVQHVPRLGERVAGGRPVGSPRWEHDPHFDLSYHLRRLRLAPPAGLEDLLSIASTAAMAGFDRQRPLWEFVVVEGLEGGRAALVQKFHHSLTDGVGGLRLAARLFDLERVAPAPDPPAAAPDATAGELDAGTGRRLLALPAAVVRGTAAIPRGLLRAGARAARSPGRTVAAAADALRFGARLVAPVSAPLSPVLRGRGTSLRFDTLEVDLGALRAAADAAGGKVNDAFLAAVLGGLARYHAEHGADAPVLRMTLPISIRTDADPLGSNRITLVRFVAALDGGDVRARFDRIREQVAEWREGPAPAITDLLTRVLNALPGPAVTAIFGGMLKNVDFVATNVQGFPIPFYVAGAEVLRLFAFAPTCGSALNVSLVSHVGRCCVGVTTDTAAVPDPDVLLRCLRGGFDEVLAMAPAPPGSSSSPAPRHRTALVRATP